jgi:hypothetical protein
MAAGTAAALALKAGVRVRNVNVADLKESLMKQKVVLPENLPKARMGGSAKKSPTSERSGLH